MPCCSALSPPTIPRRFANGNVGKRGLRVAPSGKLFYSPQPDVVLIMIYSDTRLAELGGEEEVKGRRYKAWQRDFEKMLEHVGRKRTHSSGT